MDKILQLTIQHISLTSIAILVAILIGIPLGILITRVKFLKKIILGFVNLVQSVPSMAVLGLVVPILGIGSTPAIFMVVLYSLLPIVKNTYIGISNIDPVVLESAKGIGLTKNQTLFKIQLPLALPIIMGGIRISAVTAVGLMTLAAFIGAGGLGYLVFSGVQTVNNAMILQGAIPACILALVVDFIFGKIEVLVTPTGISTHGAKKNTKSVKIVLGLTAALLVFTIAPNLLKKDKETITIGSKNFTEQLILGNIYSDLIEEYTDLEVDRKLNLGGTSVAFNALTSNELDMYVDYTGTVFMNVMNRDAINDKDKVYNDVKDSMSKDYNLTVMDPIGFNNTYVLGVMPDIAEKYNLNTISDLKKYSKDLIFSPTLEFENREDGLLAMGNYYNIDFPNINAMDGALRYTALSENKSQIIDAFSTDGLIQKFDVKLLEDDKQFFVPYYAIPMVNNNTLEKYPELEEVFDMLTGKIDEKTMTNLNYKVDELGMSPEDVSKEFIKEMGLSKVANK